MWKRIAVAGAVTAAIVGAGTAALAVSGTATPAPGTPSANAGKEAAAKHDRNPLKHALHAQWVTRDATSSDKFITHDAIRGEVTSISPTSITVKTLDISQTYVVNSDTKVHTKADGKGNAGTIGEVHSGDRVVVLGTGTTTLTATQIGDAGPKK